MRKRTENNSRGDFFTSDALVAEYRIAKKTIQEYVNEIVRDSHYRSIVNQIDDGAVLDDRSRLIDLYESGMIQDAHVSAVLETLFSYMTGERYMLCTMNGEGKLEKDKEQSEKIQGQQFEKIIKEILYSQFFGYSVIEINPKVDELTGHLAEINSIERRNILPGQRRVVQRSHQWDPGWDLDDEQYVHRYALIDSGGLGMFAPMTPLVLSKKYTIANWVNFSHTYGQPIIHGKTSSESKSDRQYLATQIANAAQKKVLVTGKDDEIDVKTFTMSNSEKIYQSLIDFSNAEISNLVLGSESMAGATQSYVGSTKAHEDIFRARIKTYRRIVENEMNEKIIPRLVYWGFLEDGVIFKYSNQIEMSMDNKIKLYDMLTNKYEIEPDVIEREFGITVGEQINASFYGTETSSSGEGSDPMYGNRMSDEEYLKRYGHPRQEAKVNFLQGDARP
jgi:hypothetical protein